MVEYLSGSRSTYTFKFGFIALDILGVIAEDRGEYVCRVTSATGVAESRAILNINVRAGIEKSAANPNSLQYIQQLEDYSKYQRRESLDETVNKKPAFIRPLQNNGQLEEGRNAHFEGQITPVNDPTLRVEWYKDGHPITASSRITAIFNFGYVSLNILHLRAEDAGSYVCHAVNRLGEAISSATVEVISRNTVTADLGIPEQQRFIESVEELESYRKQQNQKYVHEVPESISKPEFKSAIRDQLNVKEGGFAHFEARLEPIGDSTLRVEWYKDGQPVKASSRITSFFNFGYVALTVKEVTIHDIGRYTCRAVNACGEATTVATLSVVTKNDISFDTTNAAGLQKIHNLEDSSRYHRREEADVEIFQKPRFLGPLKGTNKILEGQRAHFEARVEPQNDSTLRIEWYHNNKPLFLANRVQTYHDFGYVALDILDVRADDGGVYTVIARNAAGEEQLSGQMIVESK